MCDISLIYSFWVTLIFNDEFISLATHLLCRYGMMSVVPMLFRSHMPCGYSVSLPVCTELAHPEWLPEMSQVKWNTVYRNSITFKNISIQEVKLHRIMLYCKWINLKLHCAMKEMESTKLKSKKKDEEKMNKYTLLTFQKISKNFPHYKCFKFLSQFTGYSHRKSHRTI